MNSINGKETMNAPLIEIANQHDESCGVAPSFMKRAKDDFYCSYFETACGDQLLFIFNRQPGMGYFWAGDVGWDCRTEISNNKIQNANRILAPEEYAWLRLCWWSATGGEELEMPVHLDIQDWLKAKEKVKSKRKKKSKKRVAAKR